MDLAAALIDNSVAVQKLSCAELAIHLTVIMDENLVSVFRENEVDGETFLTLTDSELKELGLKFGQVKKVRNYIAKLVGPQASTSMNHLTMANHHQSSNSINHPAMTNHDSSLTDLNLSPDFRQPPHHVSPKTVFDEHDVAASFGRETDGETTTMGNGNFAGPVTPRSRQETNENISPFDVKAVLGQSTEGRRILEKLEDDPNMLLEEDDRKIVVQKTVAELIRKSSYYPSADEKDQLGSAIVSTFPSAAYRGHGLNPWVHFFCRKTSTGFIQQRLKDARFASKCQQRAPYKKRGTSCSASERSSRGPNGTRGKRVIAFDNVEDVKSKVQWLKTHPSNALNYERIVNDMESTFDYRRSQIETNELKDAGSILGAYPRFIDHDNGSLFWVEFLTLYPETETFEKFETYVPKLTALARKSNTDFESTDEMLKALLLCFKLNPAIQKIKKTPYHMLEESFIYFHEEPFDIQGFTKKRYEHLSQPFLLCTGSRENPVSFYLIIDRQAIPCGYDVRHAFKTLFASFYVLNVHYPPFTNHFFLFFEHFIFNIAKTSAPPLLLNFVSKLQNTVI